MHYVYLFKYKFRQFLLAVINDNYVWLCRYTELYMIMT